jgi:anion-transporting  ArsA/GET3 family ATPase
MTDLFDLRLLVVSGKGGVGRTTVAAALATAAAARGKRVLIAQTATAERLGRIFGRPGPIGPDIARVAPGVDAVNMTPQRAIHEYAVMVLRSELVYRAIFENRAVRGFLAAVPGLDAYSMLGKAWFHTTERNPDGRARYDLVILDAPASGHASLMLRIPQAILDATPKGPLSRDARAMRDLLSDPARTALVIVTLAEELPARETAELAAIARDLIKMPLGPVIVNALPPGELAAPAVAAVLDRLGSAATGDAALDATLRLAAGVRAHRRVAEQVLEQLRRNPGLPIVTLPRLPTAEMGPAAIAELAKLLQSLNTDGQPSDVGRGGKSYA